VFVRALTRRSLLGLLLVGHIDLARAQSDPNKTFFRGSDLEWAGAFALGSYALSRFDPPIAQYFQRPKHQMDPSMRRLAEGFTHVQETTLTIGGLVTYGIARLAGARTVEVTALHATEAIVAASLTSQVIRGTLGRARPKDATPIFEDQYEFHWFNGFRNFEYRAFPSIHSSSAFAAATAIVLDTHHRSPGSTWYVAPIAYLIASGPAYSRMYLGQHWASDVFMGAFLGAFYGTRVVDYTRAHPDNRIDRFFLGRGVGASGLMVTPDSRGVSILFGQTF
jgi:membrane-associated phospholipid phosphatase